MSRAVGTRGQQDTDLAALLLFQYRTVLVPVVKSPGLPKIPGKSLSFIYFAPDAENPEIHRPVFLELTPSPEMTYRTLPGTSNEMNVLGIVIFSATIGTRRAEPGLRARPAPLPRLPGWEPLWPPRCHRRGSEGRVLGTGHRAELCQLRAPGTTWSCASSRQHRLELRKGVRSGGVFAAPISRPSPQAEPSNCHRRWRVLARSPPCCRER